MKPYGREKKVTRNPNWKRDYHIHEKGRKVANWWESICSLLSRSTLKQRIKREINNDI